MPSKEECLVCHSPIVYLPAQEDMVCVICSGIFPSNARCQNGHYICDACHEKEGLAVIRKACLASDSKNPLKIALNIMEDPFIHMHGPEHHVLVGSCLLATCRNAGHDLDLEHALSEMERRGSQVPGGICGLWGSCGAAVSAGIYWSILTGASPLSAENWGQANSLTSRCLSRISKLGGPRCCKRNSFIALDEAAAMTNEVLGIPLERNENTRCTHLSRNAQCLGKRCPYCRS